MKLSQLSLADYNQLDSIPVINQDLSASGFTPVANTYYRHTGATTDTFTQGVIYLYDTTYHKLGESGGGTTLNRYTYTVSSLDKLTVSQIYHISNIIAKAKYINEIRVSKYQFSRMLTYVSGGVPDSTIGSGNSFTMYFDGIDGYNSLTYTKFTISTSSNPKAELRDTTFTDGNFVTTAQDGLAMEITYYNDTEIK